MGIGVSVGATHLGLYRPWSPGAPTRFSGIKTTLIIIHTRRAPQRVVQAPRRLPGFLSPSPMKTLLYRAPETLTVTFSENENMCCFIFVTTQTFHDRTFNSTMLKSSEPRLELCSDVLLRRTTHGARLRGGNTTRNSHRINFHQKAYYQEWPGRAPPLLAYLGADGLLLLLQQEHHMGGASPAASPAEFRQS